MSLSLAAVEQRAAARGLLLRLQVRHRLGLQTLRVVVARPSRGPDPAAPAPADAAPGDAAALRLLGELKGWALPSADGLHLDTLRVQGAGSHGVGLLIWAATFAWALECSPCRRGRLLAIRDGEEQHRQLVRYFQRLGFTPIREVGSGPLDLALRLVWGGSGLLMQGDCTEGLARCERLLRRSPPDPGSG